MHFRHDDVAKEEIDLAGVVADELDGFAGGAGAVDAEAGIGEHGAEEIADDLLILEDEDGFAILGGRGAFGGELDGLERRFLPREVEAEEAPLPRLAFHADGAAALLDDAVDGGEAQAGAAPGALGGEEGLEDARLGFPIHAAAGIGDAELHVPAGEELGAIDAVAARQLLLLGGDGKRAAGGHGIARVHAEVQDHLLQLAFIRAHPGIGGGGIELDADVFADDALEELFQIEDERIEIENDGLEELLAAEGEELAGEAGGLLAGLADEPNLLARALALYLQLQHFGIADDGGEEIVEIVGHAAGQPPDGLQLLRVAEQVLGMLQLVLGLAGVDDRFGQLAEFIVLAGERQERGGILLAQAGGDGPQRPPHPMDERQRDEEEEPRRKSDQV